MSAYKHVVFLMSFPQVPGHPVQVSKTSLEVGGSVTLTAMMEAMQSLVKALPEHQTCAFRAILEQLKYFAGVQIRNAASVAGNICTGSPISDLNPLYMACGAVFTAIGKGSPEHQVKTRTTWLDAQSRCIPYWYLHRRL